jgi:hypothetical protein
MQLILSHSSLHFRGAMQAMGSGNVRMLIESLSRPLNKHLFQLAYCSSKRVILDPSDLKLSDSLTDCLGLSLKVSGHCGMALAR